MLLMSGLGLMEKETALDSGIMEKPNNLGNEKNCVHMIWNVWFDSSCNESYSFLCYEDETILVQEN